MIEYEDLIFTCLEDIVPHHVDVVGEGLTRRLIADIIQGKSSQSKKAEHGRHIDLGVPISDILSFAGLVISVLRLYLQLKASKQPKDRAIPESEEAFVRVVVEKYGPGSPQEKIAVTVYQRAQQSLRPSESDR